MLVAGNWKMNGLRGDLNEVSALAARTRERRPACGVLLCPPATLIGECAEAAQGSPLMIGGQDCHQAESGAHTGDISAAMLADLGCSYVIIGHSERRADHNESDMLVGQKLGAAQQAGLIAIVCVGETADERDAGKTLAIVESQVELSVPDFTDANKLAIAYEPVWAIGSGDTPSANDIESVHSTIRTALRKQFGDAGGSVPILYGGSVNGGNAGAILGLAEVDGALVGGASLTAEEFWPIIDAVDSLAQT